MANEEHLEILKQGVEVWNEWRGENLGVQPDLFEADLREADLSGANLSETNLIRANLFRVPLFGVDFYEANLREANLSEAYLNGARLEGANLSMADLSRANVSQADLRGAHLAGVDLSGADLRWSVLSRTSLRTASVTQAVMGLTIFGDMNLSEVTGLETVDHYGPSTIGIDTIYRSNGNISESFLRGAGVPDTFIEFARSLARAEQPIEYYSCFISYSSDDEALAQRLYNDLQAAGVRCWFAPEDMKIGDPILTRIDESIRMHEKLLLILSENSVNSTWVEREVHMAFVKEERSERHVLFPIRVDDAVMEIEGGWPALVRSTRHIGDFTQWKDHDAYQEAFERLLRDLKAKE